MSQVNRVNLDSKARLLQRYVYRFMLGYTIEILCPVVKWRTVFLMDGFSRMVTSDGRCILIDEAEYTVGFSGWLIDIDE